MLKNTCEQCSQSIVSYVNETERKRKRQAEIKIKKKNYKKNNNKKKLGMMYRHNI